jgi:hypothetical protein
MSRPVKLESRLAPMPAIRRALELIELAGYPMHEHIVEARKVLRMAHQQAEIVADAERPSDEGRTALRGILGADVNPDWSEPL